MEQGIFSLSLIIEAATEKLLQFLLPLKSIFAIFSKNFGFVEQKCIFEHRRKVKTRKKTLK
jgi:hypothetical protein